MSPAAAPPARAHVQPAVHPRSGFALRFCASFSRSVFGSLRPVPVAGLLCRRRAPAARGAPARLRGPARAHPVILLQLSLEVCAAAAALDSLMRIYICIYIYIYIYIGSLADPGMCVRACVRGCSLALPLGGRSSTCLCRRVCGSCECRLGRLGRGLPELPRPTRAHGGAQEAPPGPRPHPLLGWPSLNASSPAGGSVLAGAPGQGHWQTSFKLPRRISGPASLSPACSSGRPSRRVEPFQVLVAAEGARSAFGCQSQLVTVQVVAIVRPTPPTSSEAQPQ